jgi:signal transduction histidine kinase
MGIARVVWVTLTILAIALFVAATLEAVGEPLPRCAQSGVECDPVELSAEDLEVLRDSGLPLGLVTAFFAGIERMLNVIFLVVGAVIFWRRADDWVALLFSITLVLLGMILFTSSFNVLLRTRPELWWVVFSLGYLGVTSLFLLLYVFPDGRFVPGWTRFVMLPSVVILLDSYSGRWRLPELVLMLWLTAIVGSAVYARIYRYRRVSTPVERQQTKWVAFGLMGALGVVLTWYIMASNFPPDRPGVDRTYALLVSRPILVASASIFPLSTAFAILRYRLYDIDILINRTLVYGGLTAGIVGLYVLLIGALGAVFQSSGHAVIAVLATGLAALLVQPLRARLQRSVNRLMYGERDDPYTVLSRLSQQLKTTLAPAAVLPTMAQVVAQTLKLPYVALALGQGERLEIVAACGRPTDDVVQFPLVYQAETVGQLLVAPRAPGEAFTPAEQRLLHDIALQAGVAVHAVRLTADLQRSRERLITAREEERRRLHRDLHDGLGPQLASLTLTIAAARELIRHDVDAADLLLKELAKHTQAAIADIRRVVYALRPPALDDLGLVLALRERAASYSQVGLQITLDAPEQLPPLPAAVEVAAYRIVQEALTNVVRHAQARSCVVRLTLGDVLGVEISDDGVGLPPGSRAGVGLTSMRERTAELGGTWRIESVPSRGTCISVQLPLDEEGVCSQSAL